MYESHAETGSCGNHLGCSCNTWLWVKGSQGEIVLGRTQIDAEKVMRSTGKRPGRLLPDAPDPWKRNSKMDVMEELSETERMLGC